MASFVCLINQKLDSSARQISFEMSKFCNIYSVVGSYFFIKRSTYEIYYIKRTSL